MRASIKEMSVFLDTKEMTMYRAVWGGMHAEYTVFKKRFKAVLKLPIEKLPM